jgi:hypothetical protein
MGLLRRAATAATLDDEKTLEPPEAPEVSAPDPAVAEVPPRPIKRQGLLHRSLQALIAAVEAMPQQAEVGPREAEAEAVPQEAVGPHEAAAEVVAPLSVELAPGSIPVAEPADTEPAFDSPPEPALDFASVPAAEPIPELATEPVQGDRKSVV